MPAKVDRVVSDANGGEPAKSSWRMTPSDQISDLGSIVLGFRTCSGDMYCGDPTSAFVFVQRARDADFGSVGITLEIPKSSTLMRTDPSGRRTRKRFAGFRSR